MELIELRRNYKNLNYSIIDIHFINKILLYPIFLILITLFSSSLLATKKFKNTTFKILIGLFFSVVIYYLNNFSYVLGSTERIPFAFSIIIPMLLLTIINFLMLYKVNEK